MHVPTVSQWDMFGTCSPEQASRVSNASCRTHFKCEHFSGSTLKSARSQNAPFRISNADVIRCRPFYGHQPVLVAMHRVCKVHGKRIARAMFARTTPKLPRTHARMTGSLARVAHHNGAGPSGQGAGVEHVRKGRSPGIPPHIQRISTDRAHIAEL